MNISFVIIIIDFVTFDIKLGCFDNCNLLQMALWMYIKNIYRFQNWKLSIYEFYSSVTSKMVIFHLFQCMISRWLLHTCFPILRNAGGMPLSWMCCCVMVWGSCVVCGCAALWKSVTIIGRVSSKFLSFISVCSNYIHCNLLI